MNTSSPPLDSILIVDDDRDLLDLLKLLIKEMGFACHISQNPKKALKIVRDKEIDLVITDIYMSEMDGLELLSKLKEEYPPLEVIVISKSSEIEDAVHALREGALDFLTKPITREKLEAALLRSKKYFNLLRDNKQLKESYKRLTRRWKIAIDNIVGKSEEITHVKELIQKAGEFADTTVMITGESGTGKELIAKAIHYSSSRKDEPFITVNCAAIPENLIESEFFGHKKGAFTGADADKVGFFAAAQKGSVFLDEVGEMPQSAQSKLLRALEDKQIRPVGSSSYLPFEARVLAATNRNLEEEVNLKNFRQDLFYRLNVFTIQSPPLRERPEDIPILVEYFLKEYSKKLGRKVDSISDQALGKLIEYPFPGNVRELRNLMERAIILTDTSTLKWSHFQGMLFPSLAGEGSPSYSTYSLEENEKKLIQTVLEETQGNKSEAARLLGISWQALDRKIKKYNL